MSRGRRLKITPVLIALNILVIGVIVIFYGTRFIFYYNKFNGKKTSDGTVSLVNEILKKQSYVDLTTGLVFDEENNIYRYKGNVDDNYIEYSGILYRIIGIDNENNVKAVSDNVVTLMYSGLEKGFSKSYVNKWLNKSDVEHSGIYKNTMYGSEEYLSYTYMCNDVIDDLANITCEDNTNDYEMTLLSLYDYANAGGKESYLNNGESFYLSTLDSNKGNYFITESGEVGINKITSKVYGVRPVITFTGKTKLLSGNGTKNEPYRIESHDINNINDVYVGDIIKFNDSTYKVVSKDEKGIRAALNGVLTIDGKEVTRKFNNSNSRLSANSGNLGRYLNVDYYQSMENKDYLDGNYWYVSTQTLNNLDYSKVYDSKTFLRIGILGLSDLFINEVNNVFTVTRGIESDDVILVLNKDGNIYSDLVTSSYNIRPVFNFKNNIEIKSGKGTVDSPYVLGELNEEE